MRIIGSANEFWRVRITRMDTTGDLDFEWRADVLYREPSDVPVEERDVWQVEAVAVDDRDVLHVLDTFEDRDAAERFAATVREALLDMTKSQFETAYLAGGPASQTIDSDSEEY